MTATSGLAQGTLLAGRYRIAGVLGTGGTATAYRAEDIRTRETCVVKELRLERSAEWKVVELFEREARLLARLDHPRVPRFRDWFSEDEGARLYLVEDLVEGRSLAALLRDGRHFTESEAVDLALELAEVLRYIHSAEPPVVHRDIKPSNVLVADSGPGRRPHLRALIDFGAAREELELGRRAQQGQTVAGSFGYMPFEQFEGRASPRSDLYALGATVAHLLAHREPSAMLTPEGRIDFGPYVNVSAGLRAVLARLTEPRPEHRYPDAAALITDLQALRSGQRLPAWRPDGLGPAGSIAGGLEPSQGSRSDALLRLFGGARVRELFRRPRRAVVLGLALAALVAAAWRLAEPGVTTVSLGKEVSHLVFAGNARVIAAGADGTLGAWRIGRRSPDWTLRPRNGTWALAASPDGKILARGTNAFDRWQGVHLPARLELYRAEDGVPLQVLPWHRQRVHDLAFSPDGSLLAVVGLDFDAREHFERHGEIRLLHLGEGGVVDLDARPLIVERGGGQPFFSVAFSPDGKTLAYLSRRFAPGYTHLGEHELVLRNLAAGRETACPLPERLVPTHVRFAPDGNLLAVGGTATEIVQLVGRDCRPRGRLAPPPRDYSFRAFVGPLFAAGGVLHPASRASLVPWSKLRWLRPSADAVRELVLYDPSTQAVRRRWPLRQGVHGHAVQALAISPDGRWLAAGYGDIYAGAFKMWRID
jgi:WD40 repeat protein